MPRTGNRNKLNTIKGCTAIMEIDSNDTTLYNKILPKNILLKDTRTDEIYLTDGVTTIENLLNQPLYKEMTAAEVTAIAGQILT
jgi:hypothetical protein